MNLINKYFPKEGVIEITIKLLKELKIRVTDRTVENDLRQHPDYPSLLSIKETLTLYGIDSLCFRTDISKINQIPLPAILPLDTNSYDSKFVILLSADESFVKYYDPDSCKSKILRNEDLSEVWESGVVMVVDGQQGRDEPNYITKRNSKSLHILGLFASSLLIIIAAASRIAEGFMLNGSSAFNTLFLFVLTITGIVATSLILLHEIDNANPLIKQLCKAGESSSCNEILHSKSSKLWGVSWGAIGFTYFSGSFMSLLVLPATSTTVLFIIGWLSLFSVPYILFSLYYQWQVAKQWCILCLSVQLTLGLQFISITGFGSNILSLNNLILVDIRVIVFCYTLPAAILMILIPSLKRSQLTRNKIFSLSRLKYNKQIFETLLSKQKQIQSDSEGLGITLGNRNAKNKIIKVCNPYCEPCAKAHLPLEELMMNNHNIQVQIIFTASVEDSDVRREPVRHFLAIQEEFGSDGVHKALKDWYHQEEMSYPSFAEKYPAGERLMKQNDKVNAMKSWCDETQVFATPTFFVNGYQLPDVYSVADLRFFLSA